MPLVLYIWVSKRQTRHDLPVVPLASLCVGAPVWWGVPASLAFLFSFAAGGGFSFLDGGERPRS